jgi:hypothetical protein
MGRQRAGFFCTDQPRARHRAEPLKRSPTPPATYKTEHITVGRFAEPGEGGLLAGPSRNLQVFDPLDFLAEVTQHMPEPGEHLIGSYGWYSNKARGRGAQRERTTAPATGIPARSPSAREARRSWAALSKQVCESKAERSLRTERAAKAQTENVGMAGQSRTPDQRVRGMKIASCPHETSPPGALTSAAPESYQHIYLCGIC